MLVEREFDEVMRLFNEMQMAFQPDGYYDAEYDFAMHGKAEAALTCFDRLVHEEELVSHLRGMYRPY